MVGGAGRSWADLLTVSAARRSSATWSPPVLGIACLARWARVGPRSSSSSARVTAGSATTTTEVSAPTAAAPTRRDRGGQRGSVLGLSQPAPGAGHPSGDSRDRRGRPDRAAPVPGEGPQQDDLSRAVSSSGRSPGGRRQHESRRRRARPVPQADRSLGRDGRLLGVTGRSAQFEQRSHQHVAEPALVLPRAPTAGHGEPLEHLGPGENVDLRCCPLRRQTRA